MWMIILSVFALIGLVFVISVINVGIDEKNKKRAQYFASVFRELARRTDVAKDVAGRDEIQGTIAWCWRQGMKLEEAVAACVDRARRGMVTGEERYFLGERY